VLTLDEQTHFFYSENSVKANNYMDSWIHCYMCISSAPIANVDIGALY